MNTYVTHTRTVYAPGSTSAASLQVAPPPGQANTLVTTTGAVTEGDGGGGTWRWDPASVLADNIGTVVKPASVTGAGRWLRIRQKFEVQAVWWGPAEGKVTDASPAIQAAIDFAASEIAADDFYDKSIAVRMPAGGYRIATALRVTSSRIALIGPAGRGCELYGAGDILYCGKGDRTSRLSFISIENIIFRSASLNGANTGIHFDYVNGGNIDNCQFFEFSTGIRFTRTNNCFLTKTRLTTSSRTSEGLALILIDDFDPSNIDVSGDVSQTGGALHITDCDGWGSNDYNVAKVKYGILVYAVDGLFMNNNHFGAACTNMSLQPQGTPASRVMINIKIANMFFDHNALGSLTERSFEVVGTVRNAITMGNAVVLSSQLGQFEFTNCIYSGGGVAVNSFFFDITDADGWDAVADPWAMLFSNCEFKHTIESAWKAAASTGKAMCDSVVLDGCSFTNYNITAVANVGGAFFGAITSGIISNCSFDSTGITSSYTISLALGTVSAAITCNNMQSALVSSQQIYAVPTILLEALDISHNAYPGSGTIINQQQKTTTTDAVAKTIYYRPIGENTGGKISVIVTGKNAAGTKFSSHTFTASYRRVGTGTAVLSTGTANMVLSDAWNPDSMAVPTGTLGSDALNIKVTGAAAETFYWQAQVNISETT